MSKIDVVFLLAPSSWNQEIRYSLRSIEANLISVGNIWIVGYLPPYIDSTRVHHFPEPPMHTPGVYVESAARRWFNANLDGLSEDYIFAPDDCYWLKPTTVNDLGPLLVEELSEVRFRGMNPWQRMVWRTYDLLVFMGYPTRNLESHSPSIVNREAYTSVAERFINTEMAAHDCYDGICMITAYGNIVYPRNSKFRNANEVRTGFTNPNQGETEREILKRIDGMTFFFHDDAGLTSSLKKVISNMFPRPSRWEIS